MKRLSLLLFLLVGSFGAGCGDKSSPGAKNEAAKQVAQATSSEETSELKAAEAKQEEKSTEDKPVAGPGERAVARWQAMIELDWDKAYAFETPAFREAYTVNDLRSNYGNAVTWKKVKLLDVQLDAQNTTADVALELTTLFLDAGGGEIMIPNVLNERWLKKDGQWWYARK